MLILQSLLTTPLPTSHNPTSLLPNNTIFLLFLPCLTKSITLLLAHLSPPQTRAPNYSSLFILPPTLPSPGSTPPYLAPLNDQSRDSGRPSPI